MQLIQAPVCLPGSCKVCGSGTKGPFVDTEVIEDFYGRVYYCYECAGLIARLVGFISQEEVVELQQENESLSQDNFNLKKRVDGLEQAVNGLTSARDAFSSLNMQLDGVLPTPAIYTPGTQSTESELGDREGTSPESSNDSDVGELHSTSRSDENSFRLEL